MNDKVYGTENGLFYEDGNIGVFRSANRFLKSEVPADVRKAFFESVANAVNSFDEIDDAQDVIIEARQTMLKAAKAARIGNSEKASALLTV